MEAMHQLQLENNNLGESLLKLQVGMSIELEEEKTNSPPASTNLLSIAFGPSSTLYLTPLHPTTSLDPRSICLTSSGVLPRVHKPDQAYCPATAPMIFK
jgi:hypothetical protein